MLATGTAISAKFDAGISSRTHKAGQNLTGTVSSDVKDKSGRVVIPAGSKVHVTIAAIHESERKSDKTGKLVLTPTKVVIGGPQLSGDRVGHRARSHPQGSEDQRRRHCQGRAWA